MSLKKKDVRSRKQRHSRRYKEEAIQIGERIIYVRANASQTEFARMLDVQQQTLSRFETGERLPNTQFILDFAEILGVNPRWLLLGEGRARLAEKRSMQA